MFRFAFCICLPFALLNVADGQVRKQRFDIGLNPYNITVDKRERTYRLVVPPRTNTPMPVVFVLHGGGFSESLATHVIGYTQFTKVALRENFIVIYPVGVDGNWNDGRDVEFNKAQKEDVDDVKFFRAIVDEVAKSHPVDRSRIFSTGISNGAFMSNRFGAEASDLVAGVAQVVGSMSRNIAKKFKPEYPVSLFVIQGDADPLVPITGGPVGYNGKKQRVIALPMTEVVRKYVKRNGIQGQPEVSVMKDADTSDATITKVTTHPEGEGGAKVLLHFVQGGGHTWPGKRQYLTENLVGKTSRDYDATEAIWAFFQSCPPRRLKVKVKATDRESDK